MKMECKPIEVYIDLLAEILSFNKAKIFFMTNELRNHINILSSKWSSISFNTTNHKNYERENLQHDFHAKVTIYKIMKKFLFKLLKLNEKLHVF